jgi:hypothetical protein
MTTHRGSLTGHREGTRRKTRHRMDPIRSICAVNTVDHRRILLEEACAAFFESVNQEGGAINYEVRHKQGELSW